MCKRCQLENEQGGGTNVRVEEWIVIGCVECTVYVYTDMPPNRGGWGVALGSLCRMVSHAPRTHCHAALHNDRHIRIDAALMYPDRDR
jgi:hypothetical protein